MKNLCQFTKEGWEAYNKGTPLTFQEMKEITDHLHTCSACREFAYQHSFYSLLKASYEGDLQEPSERFFAHLEKKLKEIEYYSQPITFIEILLQKGWKLVPVMTVLLVLLLGSFAYQYENISTITTHTPIEEVILFEDTLLNESHIIYAITTEELKNGQ